MSGPSRCEGLALVPREEPEEEPRFLMYPAVSLVSFNPEGSHNHPARDACALASGGFSLLLAVEIAFTGRAASDRDGPTRTDSADERGEPTVGRRRAFM